MTQPSDLPAAISARDATVAVIGLGYVGLPLARAAADAGYRVIGYDNDPAKIDKLARGDHYLGHLGDSFVRDMAASFKPTSDEADIAAADIIALCVPTPLGKHQEPDLRYVIDSAEMVGRQLATDPARPRLVILESSTYPGTTRDVVRPALERGAGKPLPGTLVAYSPEREDPAREGYTTRSIPRLVGGLDEPSGDAAEAFYTSIVDNVKRVSSAEVAEAAKLLENIYRAVNIAMVNEMKVVLDHLGVDIWEVIEGASTKPFGFQAFYPGPGIGGHCIPVDPFYLAWRAREAGVPTRFIELAGEVNREMPRYVIDRVTDELGVDGKPLRGADVLVVGMAYKPNVADIRETPAADIVVGLLDRGAKASFHDPFVPRFPTMRKHRRLDLESEKLTPERLAAADCVLVVTDHDTIDWTLIGKNAGLVVDTRNAMAHAVSPTARIVKA